MALYWIWLLAITVSLSHQDNMVVHSSQGAIFVDKGKLTLTQSQWVILISVDLNSVVQSLETLNSEIETLQQYEWFPDVAYNAGKSHIRKPPEKRFLASVSRLLNATSRVYLSESHEIEKQINQLNQLLTPSLVRDKREINPVMELLKPSLLRATEVTLKAIQYIERQARFNRYALCLDLIERKYDSFLKIFSKSQSMVSDRVKRSLVPAFGRLLKSVAGVATQSDLDKLSARLDIMSKGQKRVDHILDQAVTLINVTRIHALENRKHVLALENSTSMLRFSLQELKNELRSWQYVQTSEMIMVVQILSLLQDISSTVAQLTDSLRSVVQMVTDLLTGVLSPSLLAPDQLASVLKEIRDALPVGLTLDKRIEGNLLHFYKSISVHLVAVDSGYAVLARLALKPVNSDFNIYEIIPLPIKPPNSDAYVYLDFSHKYIGISSDTSKYFMMNTEDLPSCLNDITIPCSVGTVLRTTVYSTECAILVFKNKIKDAMQVCNRRIKVFKKPNIVITHITEGLWYILPFRPTQLTYDCPEIQSEEMEGRIVTVSTPQTISVRNGCSVSSEGFEIPRYFKSANHVTSNFSHEVDFELSQHFYKDLQLLNNATFQKNPRHADLIVPDFVKPTSYSNWQELDLGVDELKQKIAEHKRLSKEEAAQLVKLSPSPSHSFGYFGKWILIAGMIGVVIFLLIFFFKRRKAGLSVFNQLLPGWNKSSNEYSPALQQVRNGVDDDDTMAFRPVACKRKRRNSSDEESQMEVNVEVHSPQQSNTIV